MHRDKWNMKRPLLCCLLHLWEWPEAKQLKCSRSRAAFVCTKLAVGMHTHACILHSCTHPHTPADCCCCCCCCCCGRGCCAACCSTAQPTSSRSPSSLCCLGTSCLAPSGEPLEPAVCTLRANTNVCKRLRHCNTLITVLFVRFHDAGELVLHILVEIA